MAACPQLPTIDSVEPRFTNDWDGDGGTNGTVIVNHILFLS